MPEISFSELALELSDPASAIERAEAIYEERISKVANYVLAHDKVRIILLSGPSGSGKTTTANLISDKIKSMGEDCMVVSLDDFYKNKDDKAYPIQPDGDLDYESPYALDVDCMLQTLGDIVAGRAFRVPKYEFKHGGRTGYTEYPPAPHGCVIVEGLHALNPMFSDSFPKDNVLKLFVSVSTNINDESGKRIISGKRMRFTRRLVRDSIYRGADAERTLSMWGDVVQGEDTYLYPYKDTADMKFDTFHSFEVGVLKPYALGLLTEELAQKHPYVKRVRDAIVLMPDVDERLVPRSSLIREFIPGGKYEDLY